MAAARQRIVCPAPGSAGRTPSACAPAACMQVKSVLQQLTAMNPNPTIGLAEAAEMLCKHLGVALVRYTAPQPEPAAAQSAADAFTHTHTCESLLPPWPWQHDPCLQLSRWAGRCSVLSVSFLRPARLLLLLMCVLLQHCCMHRGPGLIHPAGQLWLWCC